jgi:glycerate dehydrogenase
MKIVILDALTLGADLNLDCFKRFGELSVFQTTNPIELTERIENAEVIITNKVLIGKKEIESGRALKLICVAATGYNNIDIAAARQKNIIVANVRNYSTEGVAQHTFSLILALENSLVEVVADTRAGLWSKSPVFNMLSYPFNELYGKKMGIIGYGTIGKRVAEIAKAFGMQVLIGKRRGVVYQDTERVDFEIILKESDIISIHTPLSENTQNLFSKAEFKKMKKTAILINVARGGIVNEQALYDALQNGDIKAAALDVCESEPMPETNPLPGLKNILISPHIAWASLQSRKRLIKGIEENIERYLDGRGRDINLAI